MSQKRLDPGITLLSAIALIVVGVIIFVLIQVRSDEITARIESGKEIPVLVMVENEKKLVSAQVQIIHPTTGRLAIVDIPLNLVQVSGSVGRFDVLDTVYNEKGAETFRDEVAKLLDLPLPFYVSMKIDDIRKLADFLGGFPIFVTDSIDEISESGMPVRIPNGQVVLDGDKIVDYLLFSSEHRREQEKANRRWALSKAILERLSQNSAFVRTRSFIAYLQKCMPGNIDDRTMESWVQVLGKAQFENILNQKIMGNTRTVEIADGSRELLFPHMDGQLIKEALRQAITNLASADLGRDGRPIQLEILNGTELPGIARKAQDLFVNYGFEVVRIGNAASTDQPKTQIIDRTGNLQIAQKAASIIRCENLSSQLITQGTDQEGMIDVTVILGKDFDGWYVKK